MDKDDDGELFPLSHFATNRVKLINEAFSVLRGQRLESTIIPPSLRGIDYTELKSLCLEELRKIDTLRIVDVIEGRVTGGSKNETGTVDQVKRRKRQFSDSEPSIPMSELKKKIKKVINEDDNESSRSDNDDREEEEATRKVVIKKKNKDKKKKHSKTSNKSTSSPATTTTSTIIPTKEVKKVKKNGEKVKMKKVKKLKKEKKADKVKKKSNQGKVEERSGAIPGERTLMELLELEYRAKAIKALLKFQGFNATTIDDVFNDSNSPPAPVVTKVSEPKKPTTMPSTSSVNDKSDSDPPPPPPALDVTKVSELKKPITMPSTSSFEDTHENDDEEEENSDTEEGSDDDGENQVDDEPEINADEEIKNDDDEEEGETNDNDEDVLDNVNEATASVEVSSSSFHINIHEQLDYGDDKNNDEEEIKDSDEGEIKDNFDEENKDNEDDDNNDDDEVLDNVNDDTTNVAVSSSPFHTNIHEELDYGDGRDGDGEEVATEYPDEATPITWYERWYSSKKVQKVVSSNKMYGKVRHKLKTNKKEKKIADEFAKDKMLDSAKTKSSNCSVVSKDLTGDNDSDNIPLIGSIQEYEKIFGKKIITPSQNHNVDVTNTDTAASNSDAQKLRDVKEAESDDDDDNELWGDIMGNT